MSKPDVQDASTITQPLVLSLHQLDRHDLAIAGGKGANLGELTRAGFPVPPGFVVTTAAYDSFVMHNRLEEVIAAALHDGQGAGAAIRDAFEQGSIPPEVERDVLAAYQELGQCPIAVRSSATAEDLPEAAFAGQQDTFLNIVGAQALLDAVRRCWASLWTDRAIAYRERQGVDQLAVKLAVVVQRMVAAQAAGVMFTANPVTGERSEIVIDANPGLGEAVVSGMVTPDHYVLRKRRWTWRIAERRPGRHEVVVQPRAEGGIEHVKGSDRAALPDQALGRLARVGAAIQRYFGGPQDVEWAWAQGKLYIVQSRPITALPEPPPHPSKPVQMLAGVFAEMFPIRPYPLDQTAWLPALSHGALEPIFTLLGISVPSVEQMMTEEQGVVVRFSGKIVVRPTPGILLAPFRLAWYAIRYNPIHWKADPLLAEAKLRVRDLEARDLKALSWQDLLATVREALALPLPLAGIPRRRYFPRSALAALLLRVALLGKRRYFGTLLSGVESATIAANRSLEALAAQIRANPTLAALFATHETGELLPALEAEPEARSFLADFQAFLDQYGHREVVLSTALQPTWKDAPEIVLGILKGFAAVPPRSPIGRPVWEVARDEALAHPLLRLVPLRSAMLGLLGTARCLLLIREDTHFNATLPLPVLRRTLLEMGERLVRVGVLDSREDVFHLRFDELERIGEMWPPSTSLAVQLRPLAIQRKERRAALEATPMVDPRLFRRTDMEGDALVRGTPGSPGVAEGIVRVIHNVSEFGKLGTGEVLVAPYTNPAWTPLFQRAVAVVVDSGGAGSHAAILAREYGIPAVMGTTDATRRLSDGQRVRVDGSQGLVLSATGEQAS